MRLLAERVGWAGEAAEKAWVLGCKRVNSFVVQLIVGEKTTATDRKRSLLTTKLSNAHSFIRNRGISFSEMSDNIHAGLSVVARHCKY